MTAALDDVRELARSVLADRAQPDGPGFDVGLWSVLDEVGLTLVALPEQAGGGGGGLAAAGAVLVVAGEHAAAVPLAETDLVAGWLLHSAGLSVPRGPLAASASADVAVARAGDGWAVRGTVERVGWARHAVTLALLATGPDGDHVLALDPGDYTVEHGHNLAGEPRDTVTVDTTAPADRVAPATAGTGQRLRLRAALARALLLVGAGQRALSATVSYAGQREQFGRPIGRFQAVQQQIAVMAGEVAAARAAADTALTLAERQGFDARPTGFAVAAAKEQTSQAATTIARTAHQVHGALGFTLEHPLRHATTRLWAWREECGNEAVWQAELGRTALGAGASGLWPLVTASGEAAASGLPGQAEGGG